MPGCNMVPGLIVLISLPNVVMNCCRSSPSMPKIKPGLVQNCPTPNVIEPAYNLATSEGDCFSFSGNRNTGFTLPISENTGMGSLRWFAQSNRALPPKYEPVKPTAFVCGCVTRAFPT